MKTLDNVGSTGGTHCYTIISFINLPSNIKKTIQTEYRNIETIEFVKKYPTFF